MPNVLPTSSSKNKISLVKFIISYIVLMAIFLLMIGLESIKSLVDINGAYTHMVVQLSVFLINIMGEVKAVSGSVIQLNHLAMDIQFGCNGLEAFMIYIAGILSFPTTVRHKLIGIVIGFFILQIINILRIAGLGWVGLYAHSYFHYFHVYVAQGMMIVVSFILFLIWLQYVPSQKNPS